MSEVGDFTALLQKPDFPPVFATSLSTFATERASATKLLISSSQLHFHKPFFARFTVSEKHCKICSLIFSLGKIEAIYWLPLQLIKVISNTTFD
jgi:hypothetical protein